MPTARKEDYELMHRLRQAVLQILFRGLTGLVR